MSFLKHNPLLHTVMSISPPPSTEREPTTLSLQFLLHQHALMIGLPGSGKTSQGRALAAVCNRPHLDMSEGVFRVAGAFEPGFTQELVGFSSKGQLAPDDFAFPPLRKIMGSFPQGERLILSGVPRTGSQVDPFLEMAGQYTGSDSLTAVDMELPIEEAVERCLNRARKDAARGKTVRSDDLKKEIVLERLKIYSDGKHELIEALRLRGARIVKAVCREKPGDTLVAIILALGIDAKDLFFCPQGLI